MNFLYACGDYKSKCAISSTQEVMINQRADENLAIIFDCNQLLCKAFLNFCAVYLGAFTSHLTSQGQTTVNRKVNNIKMKVGTLNSLSQFFLKDSHLNVKADRLKAGNATESDHY